MEGNGLSGSRLYANMGGGSLGLEMPLHPPTQQQHSQPQNPQIHLQKHPQISPFQQQQHEQQTQLSMKQPNYTYMTNPNPNPPQKPKTQMTQFTTSDEDEPGCSNEHESNSFDGKRKSSGNSNSMSSSPWHRMKWTDNMVRLLIMAVYYIGDDVGGSELGPEKKKTGPGGGGAGNGGGLLQKKGKWKSVSKAMMEKGFCVSPQQCEDKFNDLNKRYKRVNDILGKGTACKVVEDQSLLEGMDLSPRMKDEVRKLLNSKHLFFREMCAYHNSCSHGTGGSASDVVSAPGSQGGEQQPSLTPSQQHHHVQVQQLQQQQTCLHSTQMQPSTMMNNNSHKGVLGVEDDHDDDDEDDEDDDDDDDDEVEDEEHEDGRAMKRAKTMQGRSSSSPHASQALQHLSGEVMGMLQDTSKSSREKKQWVMRQLVQLEEQGVTYQCQALELEKQRLKWIKFSGKKEREMEKMKLDNEKKRLENERMMLLLRKKELELIAHPSNPHCVS